MSTASKLTLMGTTIGTVGIVAFVHWAQTAEKAVSLILTQKHFIPPFADPTQAMHAGVIRDMQNQRVKKERQADFEMQRQLEEDYKRVQTVSDVATNE